jgi:hypothetical protein
MPDIIAVIDLGKSLEKSIWTIPLTREKRLLFLEPEIVSLTREDIANITRENADPEKDAWLVFPDGTGEALGFVTRTSRYRNRRDIAKDELKSLHGVNRCLAILGAIAERARLTKDSDSQETKFSVVLSVLLPLSEWSTRKEFKQELLTALQSGFNFRGKQYRVSVELLDLKPEGLGVLMKRQLQLPKAVYRSRAILCLIMGHYNNSLYLYQGGQKIVDDCTSSGFHQLIDAVVAETALDASNVASNDLAEAIYYARSKPNLIKALLWQKIKDEEKLAQQVEQVLSVIEKVSADVWKSTQSWLDNSLGANRFGVNEVLVSGGASRFFRREIEEFFSGADVLWSCQINQLVGRDFQLPCEDAMAYRLADPYSVFEWLDNLSQSTYSSIAVGA